MTKQFILIILLVSFSLSIKAQFDAQYSQNMFNKLAVNPGYAGVNNNINLFALNRNQWAGLYSIKTTVFSGDMPIKLGLYGSGIGVNFINDEVGFFSNLNLDFNYSYRIEFEKGLLSIGTNVGILNMTLDGTKFTGPDGGRFNKDDPHFPKTKVSGIAFDFGLGAYYSQENLYLGISFSHLNNPKPDFKSEFNFKVSGTMYITGGYVYQVKDKPYEILPSVFYKTDWSSHQVDINTLIRYKKRYWGGLTYRFQDAIVLLAGIELRNGIRFGYSFDITTSELSKTGDTGTHELTIGYNLNINFEKHTKRYKSVRYL